MAAFPRFAKKLLSAKSFLANLGNAANIFYKLHGCEREHLRLFGTENTYHATPLAYLSGVLMTPEGEPSGFNSPLSPAPPLPRTKCNMSILMVTLCMPTIPDSA